MFNISSALNRDIFSGFIDSWDPFGSGRFFDSPPVVSSVDTANNNKIVLADDVSKGFTLKPDVTVATLNVEDSQEFMGIIDKVIKSVFYLVISLFYYIHFLGKR